MYVLYTYCLLKMNNWDYISLRTTSKISDMCWDKPYQLDRGLQGVDSVQENWLAFLQTGHPLA